MKEVSDDIFYFENVKAYAKAKRMVKDFKVNLIKVIALLYGALALVILVLDILLQQFKLDFSAELTLGGISACLFCLYVYVKKSNNEKLGAIAAHLLFLVAVPTGVFFTGGIYSTGLLFYVTHIAFGYTVFSNRTGHVLAVWAGISILAFAYLSGVPEGEFLLRDTFFNTLALVAATIPILYVVNERDRFAALLSLVERKEASSIIMKRLGHEVGNSLQIPLVTANMIASGENGDSLASVDKHLERIERLFQELRKTMKDKRIVEFLKEHDSVIEILEKMEDNQGP